MRDDDPGAVAEQAVGGVDDASFGNRVHPGGRLVEHDDLDIAYQQAREGHELLLPGGQGRASRPEHGVEALGQTRHPLGESERLDRVDDRAAGDVGEERDVVSERGRQDLGALGDDSYGGSQLLKIEVEDVDSTEAHGSRGWVHRPRQQRGEGGLAAAGAAHQGHGAPGRYLQVDVVQGESAFGIGEVEVADGDGQRARGHGSTPSRLRCDPEELPKARQGAESLLDVGQVSCELVDLTDERAGDEEQRHE